MKKSLTLSLEEEDIEAIKLLAEKTGLTTTKLFEDHARGLAKAARAAGIFDKKKASKVDLVKMFLRGAVQDV